MKFLQLTEMKQVNDEDSRSYHWEAYDVHYVNLRHLVQIFTSKFNGYTYVGLPSNAYFYAKESVAEILEMIHE